MALTKVHKKTKRDKPEDVEILLWNDMERFRNEIRKGTAQINNLGIMLKKPFDSKKTKKRGDMDSV